MKSKTILFIVLLFSFQLIAQTNGINYKAIVKDGSGNILVSSSVSVEFNILYGSGPSLIYTEAHNATTDANGLIVLVIGQGSTSDVFDDIDWGRFEHYLNVKMDSGSGFVDLGTTQFEAVPYAKHADQTDLANEALNADRLTLKSSTTNQFTISYTPTGDKLRITETSVAGNVFEISAGELTLPQYAGTGEEAIYADANGKLLRKPAAAIVNQTFNVYNFFDPVQLTGAVRYRLGVQLPDGVTIAGLSAFVLDNEPGTNTGIPNTPYLSLERESKTDRTVGSQEIFRVIGQNSPTDVFIPLITTNVIIAGRNIIDNASYIYYLEVFMCPNCDFTELTILE